MPPTRPLTAALGRADRLNADLRSTRFGKLREADPNEDTAAARTAIELMRELFSRLGSSKFA